MAHQRDAIHALSTGMPRRPDDATVDLESGSVEVAIIDELRTMHRIAIEWYPHIWETLDTSQQCFCCRALS